MRVNTLKTDMETLLRKLIGRGYETDKARYDENCLYIKNLSAVDELDLYRQGLLTVQGEASMLVCRLAGLRGGEKVLDACAAPGGKTACLACFSPSYLEAWDIHEHRLELMRQNLPAWACKPKCCFRTLLFRFPDRRQNFDVVLVDAPCSALGLLYRKPDLKYSKEQADLAALAEIQKKSCGLRQNMSARGAGSSIPPAPSTGGRTTRWWTRSSMSGKIWSRETPGLFFPKRSWEGSRAEGSSFFPISTASTAFLWPFWRKSHEREAA